MQVARLRLRDFRGYAAAEVRLGSGLTVVHGRNGAGKTNLLEALYFGARAARAARPTSASSCASERRPRGWRCRRRTRRAARTS